MKKPCAACHDDGAFCSVCGTEPEGGPVDRQFRNVGDSHWFYCNRFQWEQYKDDPEYEVRELFTRPAAEPEGAREALRQLDELEHFLGGSDHYEGHWIFNEPPGPSGNKSRYWWRSVLMRPVFKLVRAALASQAPQEKP